jgi:hypothetical protein
LVDRIKLWWFIRFHKVPEWYMELPSWMRNALANIDVSDSRLWSRALKEWPPKKYTITHTPCPYPRCGGVFEVKET